MKRWVAVVGMVAALSTLVTLTAFAQGADVIWREKALTWNNKTGTVFTGTARDTQFITDENDTTRTDWVKTSNWAFEAMKNGTAAVNIAYVTITCGTNNGVADTLYYTVEKRGRGGAFARNRTLASGAGVTAFKVGDSYSATRAIYRGTLLWDPDSPEGANQVAPGEEFRLVVQGDVDGTSPKLSGVRVTIHYPARFASAVPTP